MQPKFLPTLVPVSFLIAGLCVAAADKPDTTNPVKWNQPAAAKYLDARELWWQSWAPAQRDHGTSCVSCHTVVPYALSRPALNSSLDEQPSAAERTMMERVEKRVNLWNQVDPFYKDASNGPGKSVESRSTESVLNTLILASYDAHQGHLRDVTRKAFNAAWTLQLKDGPAAGAWSWQVFHLAPWESGESQYQGAVFMALAVGMAPDNYRNESSISGNRKSLQSYLSREYAKQPLLNRIVLLWASAKLPGLMPSQERVSLLASILEKQGNDGGWCVAKLGSWQREDHTVLDATSDGYATGLTVLALETKRHAGSARVGQKRYRLARCQSGPDARSLAHKFPQQKARSTVGHRALHERCGNRLCCSCS